MSWKRIFLVSVVWLIVSTGLVCWLHYGVTEMETAFDLPAPGGIQEAEERERHARREFLALVETNPVVLGRGVTNSAMLNNRLTDNSNALFEQTTVLREGVTFEQATKAQWKQFLNSANLIVIRQAPRHVSTLRQRIWVAWGVWTALPILFCIARRTLTPSSIA